MSLHRSHLAPYASHASDSLGRHLSITSRTNDSDYRNVFQRDRDRVIHSSAFRKLKYKTQVFIYHEGDYFRTRLSHSLEVSQVARAIARALRLDEDLSESISLAHDLGHTPFGHAGETALARSMADFGGFDHNEQTVRILTKLEHSYADFDGLNLTWEALEGIIKHNGPVNTIPPTIAELNKDGVLDLSTHASLEAQIAAISDDIAYLAHDCDDGIRAGLLRPELMLDWPLVGVILRDLQSSYGVLETSRLVNELTRRLISDAVSDVLQTTAQNLADTAPADADAARRVGYPLVSFSPAMGGQIEELRDFLFSRVWRHYKVNRMTSKAKRVMAQLFDLFMEQSNILPDDWQLVDGVAIDDLPQELRARQIADYLASMTDRYAILEHERLFDLGPILR